MPRRRDEDRGRSRPARGGAAGACLVVAALTGLTSLATPTRAQPTPSHLEVYAFPPSVAPGDSLRLYVSTDASTFDLQIERDAPSPVVVLTQSALPGVRQPMPEGAWETGCGWRPALALQIPPDWPSGVYLCRCGAGGSASRLAIFTVRAAIPGSTATILFQNSIFTWQAYNNWGGKSLYEANSTDSVRATAVSFARPYAAAGGVGDYPYTEQAFVHWLATEGIPVEFCTDLDLHRDVHLLDAYDLLLVVGHDEYWTSEQRDHVEAFVAAGGNVGIFSGNTCWWQVRLAPECDRVVCYKSKELDPLRGVDDRRVTVVWSADPVRRPENVLTGVSWRHGGFVNSHGWFPAAEGFGGYTAYHTDHWVFDGTGLTDGDGFGQAAEIVGAETDGALIRWAAGLPVVTGADGGHRSYVVLGVSPASWGDATMGVYTAGGTVFNAATINWARGLMTDPTVATITRNVLRRLAGPTPHALAPRSAPPARLQVTKSPIRYGVQVAWQGDVGSPATLSIFSLDGRRVASLGIEAGRLRGSAVWRGQTAQGARVSSGVYIAELRGPRASLATKFVIVH